MTQTVSTTALTVPIVDHAGNISSTWLQVLKVWQEQLANGFDPNGNLISNIEPAVEIIGHPGDIGSILQHLSAAGVIDADGLPGATDTEQGAVKLAPGSSGNVLGSAAMKASSDFDPAGAAVAAQAAAQSFATTAANTALTASKAYTDTSITAAFSLGISVTITTAKLTTLGSNGSMTFTNGLLTAQTPAT